MALSIPLPALLAAATPAASFVPTAPQALASHA